MWVAGQAGAATRPSLPGAMRIPASQASSYPEDKCRILLELSNMTDMLLWSLKLPGLKHLLSFLTALPTRMGDT